jgi:hypothetical protein
MARRIVSDESLHFHCFRGRSRPPTIPPWLAYPALGRVDESERQVAGTPRHIQDPEILAHLVLPPDELRHFSDVGRSGDVILPHPVQPAAHEVVHYVVRIRDAVENLPDLGLLLLPPHLLEPEVRRPPIAGLVCWILLWRSTAVRRCRVRSCGAREMTRMPSRAIGAAERLDPDPCRQRSSK